MAAMRFVLEKNKDYHRAHYQLARALASQGKLQEAAEQLRALFSTAKRPFCINMWEIADPADAKVGSMQIVQSLQDDILAGWHVSTLHSTGVGVGLFLYGASLAIGFFPMVSRSWLMPGIVHRVTDHHNKNMLSFSEICENIWMPAEGWNCCRQESTAFT